MMANLTVLLERLLRTAAASVLAGLLASAEPQVVDCVAAHVNRRAITLTDIRIMQSFHLGEESQPGGEPMSPEQVLQKAIDRAVVVDLMRENFPLPAEELEARLAALKARFEPDEWRRLLGTFGLPESGVESYLENILQYERMVSIRFGQPPQVTVPEIEAYYNREYEPSQRSQGLEPRPLSQVMDEIEGKLRERKREAEISDWIRGLKAEAKISLHQECLQHLK